MIDILNSSEAFLLTSLWLACYYTKVTWLVGLSTFLVGVELNPGPRRSKQRNKKSSSKSGELPYDRILIDSVKPTGSTTSVVESDLIAKRQNFNLVQSPPKQVGNMIFWCKQMYTGNFQTSTTTDVENNLQFQLSSLSDVSSITSFFDQYCIYSVAVNWSIDTQQAVGEITCNLYTALDYDNVSNIGLGGIVGYSTCQQSTISQGTSLVRLVKPCVAPALYSGSAFTNFGTSRLWCNSSSTNTAHYGIRAIAKQSAQVITIRVTQTWTIGLRNTI